MKKTILSSAVAALVLAGNAHAVAVPSIPADTTTIRMSGASASTDFIVKLVTLFGLPAADRICDTSQPIWKFEDKVDGKTQHAFLCKKSPDNTNLSGITTSNLLIYKRSEGGSAFGVNPLVNNDTMEFLNVASSTCAVTTDANPATSTVGVVKCEYDMTHANPDRFSTGVSDLGMSDIDPIQFRGDNNPDPALYPDMTGDAVAALTVKGASAVVFGAPVTLNLYKALQAAQKAIGKLPSTCVVGDLATEACMPSLSSAQIASLHTGAWPDWNQLKVGTTGLGLYDWVAANASAYLPAEEDVHICRRVNGSGTQAQSNAVFLNYPCADASAATTPAIDLGTSEGDGFAMVHQNSTSGGVSDCLKELDNNTNAANAFDNIWSTASAGTLPNLKVKGKRWAIGIQSLEKAGSNFEFVRIDGVAPTLAHTVDGSYKDWVENTYQYNTVRHDTVLTADQQALVKAVVESSSIPEVMKALNDTFLHGFGNGSYLAVPTLHTPAANGAFDYNVPVNPYSRATADAAVDNCRIPTIYNKGASQL